MTCYELLLNVTNKLKENFLICATYLKGAELDQSKEISFDCFYHKYGNLFNMKFVFLSKGFRKCIASASSMPWTDLVWYTSVCFSHSLWSLIPILPMKHCWSFQFKGWRCIFDLFCALMKTDCLVGSLVPSMVGLIFCGVYWSDYHKGLVLAFDCVRRKN